MTNNDNPDGMTLGASEGTQEPEQAKEVSTGTLLVSEPADFHVLPEGEWVRPGGESGESVSGSPLHLFEAHVGPYYVAATAGQVTVAAVYAMARLRVSHAKTAKSEGNRVEAGPGVLFFTPSEDVAVQLTSAIRKAGRIAAKPTVVNGA